jgi:hypothetical protein
LSVLALRKTVPLLIAFVAAVTISGCARVRVSPDILEARAVRERLFQENLAAYAPRTPGEAEILKKIVDGYKRPYEAFDLDRLAQTLSPDFELRYYVREDEVQVQTRDDFLNARRGWKPRSGSHRKLLVSVQAIHHDERKNRYAVTALTTYQSKYFRPRFLEVMVFERKDDWRLRRVLMYPMSPPRPEIYEVKIFFGQYLTERRTLRGLENEITAEGPDAVFDKYLRLSEIAPASERGMQGPLVIIFPEPPPEGAELNVSEQQLEGFGGIPRTFSPYESFVRVTRGGNPYFYLVGSGWWGYTYSVNVRVTMNGVTIADEILRIQ